MEKSAKNGIFQNCSFIGTVSDGNQTIDGIVGNIHTSNSKESNTVIISKTFQKF